MACLACFALHNNIAIVAFKIYTKFFVEEGTGSNLFCMHNKEHFVPTQKKINIKNFAHTTYHSVKQVSQPASVTDIWGKRSIIFIQTGKKVRYIA